jgi:hypothetical protein
MKPKTSLTYHYLQLSIRVSVFVVTGDPQEVVSHLLLVDKLNVDMTTQPIYLHHSNIVFWQSKGRVDPFMDLECQNFLTTLVKLTGSRELPFTYYPSPSP